MTDQPQSIAIDLLDPHPKNPRLVKREDVIEAIKASIGEGGFDPAHSIIVRPLEGRFQVISGHNRVAAAYQAGLTALPAWVREMDDDTAYMELVRANAQGELTALERGMHALHSGMDVKAYAGNVGRARTSVQYEVQAAKVADAVSHVRHELSDFHRHLAEIHSAPSWLWPALVEKLVSEGLTVEATRRLVADVKDIPDAPAWVNLSAIASAIVGGLMRPNEIKQMSDAVLRTEAAIDRAELNAASHRIALTVRLAEARPTRLSDVMTICNAIEEEQGQEVAKQRRQQAAAQQALQDREAKIAAMKSNVSLEVWKTLDPENRAMLLNRNQIVTSSSFNKQDNDAIEWAQWSWNPVTGCLHDCPYCYARDIAANAGMAKV